MMNTTKFKIAVSIVGFCLLGMFGTAQAAEPVGAALCVSCHDEEDLPDMSNSPHAIGVKKPPMSAAAAALASRPMGDVLNSGAPDCITCHGASDKHAHKPPGPDLRPRPDRTFNKVFGKVSAIPEADRSRVCQTCHDKDSKRALWLGSQHQAADVACDSCHQVHTNKDKVLNKVTQPDVCYTCHKEQRTQMNKPSHHPVPEGKMTCADCHNAHGSAGPKLAKRDSTNATCYTCHAEKRGPFVHQHDPVAEDCSNCHTPHGSTVAAMLKTRAPLLCQQCHTPHVAGGVGALGAPVTALTGGKNVANIWQGRSCMNCHTQVHGSNSPSATNATLPLLMR